VSSTCRFSRPSVRLLPFEHAQLRDLLEQILLRPVQARLRDQVLRPKHPLPRQHPLGQADLAALKLHLLSQELLLRPENLDALPELRLLLL
jgi:hypothetical protein